MKKNNLILIKIIFLLVFGTFYVSGFIVEDNSLESSDTNSFDLENRKIVYSQQERLSFEELSQELDYSGYIIEFEKPSIIERKVELEKIAEKNENLFLTKIPVIKEFFVTVDNLESKIQKYEDDVNVEHERFKEKIAKEIVLNEYNFVFNGIALDVSDVEVKEIEKIGGVKKVWPNYKVKIFLMDSVPLIQGGISAGKLDRNGDDCNITEEGCLTGEGIKIAIIDSGVDYTHNDLGGCFGESCKVIGGWDIINNDDDPMDDHGHGTHVAATAAGNGLLKGVAPDAQILAYKVLDSDGSGTMEEVIEGIEKAVLDSADIISMSLGGSGNPDDPVSQAVDNAVSVGVVSVIAAGNSGPSEQTIGSPGTARKAITVGATNKFDKIAEFSSRGPVIWKDEIRSGNVNENINENIIVKPDIVAPGVDICAAQVSNNWLSYRECLDDNHIAISGTSMATPHVAGAVALLKQKNPDWTPEEIKSALKGTSIDLELSPIIQGEGRIDVKEAVKLDEKMPVASIYAIKSETTISLFGTAKSDNFEYYKLFLNEQEILYSTSQADNVLLYDTNSKIMKNGLNTFKLEVRSVDGLVSNDFVLLDIENIKNISIQYQDIYRKGDLIPIEADILYDDYDYEIYYSKQYEDNWLTFGIVKNSENGLIAEWNTSYLSDGFYKVKMIFDVVGIGTFEKTVEKIYFDSTLKEGWPQKTNFDYECMLDGNSESLILMSADKKIVFMVLPKTDDSYVISGLNNEPLLIKGNKLLNYNDRYFIASDEVSFLSDFCYYYWAGYLEPVVEDINNDGEKEIVIYKGGNLPKILVYNVKGQLQFDKEIGNIGMAGLNINIPLVGDLDNDGKKEIIAFSIGDFSEENSSEIFAINHEGSLLWSTKIPNTGNVNMLMADLDNDGKKEVAIKESGAWDTKMIILNYVGEIISVFDLEDKKWGASIEGSPAIGNFDEDSDFEIVIADPSKDAGSIWENKTLIGENNTGVITVYNIDGTIVEGWPRYTEGVIFSSPVVGDINNDGKHDILVGLIYSAEGNYPDVRYGGLYAFDGNGNVLYGWPVEKGWEFWSTPALGDVDNDGKLEISSSSLRGVTYLFDNSGNILNGWPKETSWVSYYSEILADITGDGKLNVLTTSGGILSCNEYGEWCGGVYAWDYTGDILRGFPKVTETDAQSSATVADLNNDEYLELIASSDWDMSEKDFKRRGSIYVWDLNVPYNPNKMDWPMFMHDAQNTGCYDCDRNISQPPVPTSLSKIENLENTSIEIILSMNIQKFENNEWIDYRKIIQGNYNIPSKGSLDLGKLFNNEEVKIDVIGNYRLNTVVKDYSGKVIESSVKEFNIPSLPTKNVQQ